jgi:LysM repeat protein
MDRIAAKFGLEVEALRAVNGIGSKARVPVGHTLLVPTQGPTDAAADTLSKAVFTTVPQGRTFYYRVQRGDTIPTIAARYAVTAADIRRWNGLVQNAVTPGKTLRITSDLAPSAVKVKRAAGTPPKRVTGTIPKHANGNGAPAKQTNGPSAKQGNGAPAKKGNGAPVKETAGKPSKQVTVTPSKQPASKAPAKPDKAASSRKGKNSSVAKSGVSAGG